MEKITSVKNPAVRALRDAEGPPDARGDGPHPRGGRGHDPRGAEMRPHSLRSAGRGALCRLRRRDGRAWRAVLRGAAQPAGGRVRDEIAPGRVRVLHRAPAAFCRRAGRAPSWRWTACRIPATWAPSGARADAAGFPGLLLGEGSADPLSPKVLRAAMGSGFRVPFAHAAPLADALEALRAEGYTVIASDLRRLGLLRPAEAGGQNRPRHRQRSPGNQRTPCARRPICA